MAGDLLLRQVNRCLQYSGSEVQVWTWHKTKKYLSRKGKQKKNILEGSCSAQKDPGVGECARGECEELRGQLSMARASVHAHVHICINSYTYILIHTCTHMHKCIHMHIYAHMHTYTYMHIYTYTHIYICIYIYIYSFSCQPHTVASLIATLGAVATANHLRLAALYGYCGQL